MQSLALQLRQKQGLAITPRLAQSIRMLAMGAGEVEALIEREAVRNPFIARIGGSRHAGGDALTAIGERTAATTTLNAHIEEQIGLAFRNLDDRTIARALAAELDESGYLRATTTELEGRLGWSAERVGRVLARLREFEPAGLFAHGLADCLGLQIAARDRLDPAMRSVLGRLDLVAKRDFAALSALSGLSVGDLRDCIAEICACDPKPGAGFAPAPVPSIEPVARLVRDGSGRWRAELIGSATPRVEVDRDYAAEVAALGDEGAREWAASALADATWLERSLAQRARSIQRVANEVAARQRDYLERGIAFLRPLTLRRVADAIGVHESTVSRVVAGKAVETPLGTKALRSFFGAGVPSNDGEVAAEAVQVRIRDMIAAERVEAILSDEALCKRLRAEGIDIARRTVAKYREGLSLGSSTVRRRERLAAMRTHGERKLVAS